MMALLATGTLVSDPQRRQASNGNAYATALLRVPTEEDSVLVSVIAFSQEACESLSKLRKGDALSVSGRAKLTAWTGRDGETRHGLSVVADKVLSAYEVRKKRTPRRAREFPDGDLSFLDA